MENISPKIKILLDLMSFRETRIVIDSEHRKLSIFIDDDIVKDHIPNLLSAFDHLFNLILHRENTPAHIVDLNYYRRERERLITELARAAAKKAMMTKSEISLPPMNAYERRLIHMEITTHPELATESTGEGRERHIVIKHLNS